MPNSDFIALHQLVNEHREFVSLERFSQRLNRHLRGARTIITMGGYNTLIECVASRRPTIVIPREQPRFEQLFAPSQHGRYYPPERLPSRLVTIAVNRNDLLPVRICHQTDGIFEELIQFFIGIYAIYVLCSPSANSADLPLERKSLKLNTMTF